MKHRRFALLLVLLLALSLGACGSVSDMNSASNNPSTTADLEEGPFCSAVVGGCASALEANEQEMKDEPSESTIEIGETVTIDDVAEFSIDSIDITRVVEPPDTTGWYTYYSANEGQVIVDVCITYKNLASYNTAADYAASGVLKYADKYQYNSQSIIEIEDRSDFRDGMYGVDPLTTGYIHCLFMVPEEVESSSESIVLNMKIGGKTYTVEVR